MTTTPDPFDVPRRKSDPAASHPIAPGTDASIPQVGWNNVPSQRPHDAYPSGNFSPNPIPPQSMPPHGAPQSLPPAATANYQPALIGALAASVAIAIGSIGPWVTFFAFSKNGIDADGSITLAVSVVAAIVLFSQLVRGGRPKLGDRWIGPIAGAVCVWVAVTDIGNVSSTSTEIFGKTIAPSVGWGLWLVTLASVALFATGIVVAVQARRLKL